MNTNPATPCLTPEQIHSLLGREEHRIDMGLARAMHHKTSILITGGAGSIGSALAVYLTDFAPNQILLFDLDATGLKQVTSQLRRVHPGLNIVGIQGDITSKSDVTAVFENHDIDIVYHAAANKHVPELEADPKSGINTNIFGTVILAQLAVQYAVSRFVFVSTDKAFRPAGVMGATKRFAEQYLQALQGEHPEKTRFVLVRFGNVLSSSGSVVPLFQAQIAQGGPLTITDKRMTRYFMTTGEACALLILSAVVGTPGAICILDPGQPHLMVDMAKRLIESYGLKPYTDISIEYTAIRPGEKLIEQWFENANDFTPTHVPQLWTHSQFPDDWAAIKQRLALLKSLLKQGSHPELIEALMSTVVTQNANALS